MNTFLDLPKLFVKTVISRTKSVGVTPTGPRFEIPTNLSDIPKVVRNGLDATDETPFYEMDANKLWGYYHGYTNTAEYAAGVLYADVIALKSKGQNGFSSDAIFVEDIKVRVEPTKYRIPLALQPHADAIVQFFKDTGRIKPKNGVYENNRTAKILQFGTAGTDVVLQEASYFDQVSTNIAVDTNSGFLPAGMASIRQDYDTPQEGNLPSLDSPKMANTLGVAAMVFSKELLPLARLRNPNMGSISQNGLHCAVSGVYELPDHVERNNTYGFSILESGIILEIEMELALKRHEYTLYPVAFARELPRGGKPQLFFAVISKLSLDEMVKRAKIAEERAEYLEVNSEIYKAVDRQPTNPDQFTYEGWACAYFADKFLEANYNLRDY